ncbi:hypothetical protein VOLCADRAFT_97158 [Volvox carteri f. nagariensis]|uniref:Uncharacterized protein n=1 Tax=Volvox carteri f. nagariensis TaxID=3068 RepID=D8UC12_VOLCA|nr:uncharacterized protein VOLCADRAFT_97158 [Volvox carteri f. nagariensis]EFJ42766.1 hypothetical protein VOLCADRAFT_97158 [Volvox carteri f. nagariensis]|eukprot:XP_002956227.1 hypothetical protein VOLCADRAFT_97158 [Volvox carteri f. nagariensis]
MAEHNIPAFIHYEDKRSVNPVAFKPLIQARLHATTFISDRCPMMHMRGQAWSNVIHKKRLTCRTTPPLRSPRTSGHPAGCRKRSSVAVLNKQEFKLSPNRPGGSPLILTPTSSALHTHVPRTTA